jgi:hypothetical protein
MSFDRAQPAANQLDSLTILFEARRLLKALAAAVMAALQQPPKCHLRLRSSRARLSVSLSPIDHSLDGFDLVDEALGTDPSPLSLGRGA